MKYKGICAILKVKKGVEEKLENQKNNGGLMMLVIVLLLLVLGLGGYIVYDKVLSDKTTEPTNNDTTDNQPVVTNTTNVTLQNKDAVTIDDITAKVENGNIKFTSGNKEKVFSSVNAKYIFLVPYMDSANTRLYYITNNNELYYKNLFPFASNTFFDKEITDYGIKLTDNVVGFIGNQTASKYDSEGKAVESYPILTVLLSDGTTYSVSYAS